MSSKHILSQCFFKNVLRSYEPNEKIKNINALDCLSIVFLISKPMCGSLVPNPLFPTEDIYKNWSRKCTQ